MNFPFSLEIVVNIYYTCTLSSRGRLSMIGDLTLSPLLGLCLNIKVCKLQTEFYLNMFNNLVLLLSTTSYLG